MNENIELLKHIYQDAEMAAYTLTQTLTDLKEKDNKIKSGIEDILKGYERYKKDSKKAIEQLGEEPEEKGFMSKMGASMGINKEVKSDNSDSSIADMLIKGISMGSIDMEKKISVYEDQVDKEYLNLAKDFKKFQEENMKALKKYL